jgi:hypothetical protein
VGEYFRIVNLDKRQFFAGHSLNLSGKFSSLQGEPLSGMLVWVLTRTTHVDEPRFRGSWDGDRIVIAGDEGVHQDVFDQSDAYEDVSVALIEEWIDEDVFRAMEYWGRGLVDDDGNFVLDGKVREKQAARRKDGGFPFEKWEARHA